jgi:hypothetical protein
MFNISVEYVSGGRRVSAGAWVKALEDEARKRALAIRESVESVRCPEHAQGPVLQRQTPSQTSLGFTYAFCCEKLKKLAGQTLNSGASKLRKRGVRAKDKRR